MKKFFYTVSKIMLPILILAYPLDVLLSTLIKNDPTFAFGEISTWNDIYDSKINADILIMGSSRALVHINPNEIEHKLKKSTYNLGLTGNHFIMQNFRYNKYLMHNKPPKVIIHSIECATLERNVELYNDNQYLPYMLFDTEMMRTTKEITGFKNFQYYMPLTRFYGKGFTIFNWLSTFFMENKPVRVKGYLNQELLWTNINELNKINNKSTLLDYKTLIQYEKFINDCKKMNIKLILVYSPEYFKGQNFIINRTEIIKVYLNMAKKHHLTFLNYSNNPICFSKNYFYNNSHLNKNGAELFSKFLANDLKIYINN